MAATPASAAKTSVEERGGRRIDARLIVGLVFLVTAVLVWFLGGTKFDIDNDEGIYLEGAKAIVHGKALYKDHFAFTGPGCYWLIASCFQMFGISFLSGRIPFILDIGAIAAATFWLVRQFVNSRVAFVTAGFCVALMVSAPDMQTASHRWDSSAFACLAIAFACATTVTPNRWLAGAAGFAAAAAAWVTPTLLLAALVLAVWLWRRGQLTSFIVGGALCSLPALGYLAATGTIDDMIRALLWARANYSGPNMVPYGAINGGIERIFDGTSGIEAVIAFVIVSGLLAPAVPPVISLIAGPWILRGREEPSIRLLWFVSIALVASTHPRMDVSHLLVICAPSVVVTVYLLHRSRAGKALLQLACVPAVLLLFYAMQQRLTAMPVDTRVGRVHARPAEVKSIRDLEGRVPPASSLFVYPYMPALYFLTGGVNPTPYSFLQPGMMTESDERNALSFLQRSPPEYVFFARPLLAGVLRIWPKTDPARIHMPALENWIESHYERTSPGRPPLFGYSLLRRRDSAR